MKERDDRYLSVAEWVEIYRQDLRADGFDPEQRMTLAEAYKYDTHDLMLLEAMGVTDRQNLNRAIAAFIVDQHRVPDFAPIIFGMQLIANSGLTAPEIAGILGESIAALARIDHADPLEKLLEGPP